MDFLFPSLYGGSTFSGVPPMAPMASAAACWASESGGELGEESSAGPGRTLVDRGGPGAGPGSLGELAGNDGELAGVCRVCPSHENLHQLPPPHLTAPRTCAAWYPRGQSILNYPFFAYKTFYWFRNVFYLFDFFYHSWITQIILLGLCWSLEQVGRGLLEALRKNLILNWEITILEFSQRNLQKVSRISKGSWFLESPDH